MWEASTNSRKKSVNKYCESCGESLVLLSSRNTKYCVNCHTEIQWDLDDNQQSIYGDRKAVFDPYSSK